MTERTREFVTGRLWIGALALGVLLTVLFFALPMGSVEQSITYDILGLAVVGIALVGVWLHRPAGWLPWVILALGQLAFVGGDILWTWFAAIGEDPFPSLADASYLAGYPLLAVGLAIAIRRRITGGDRAGVLDGAILATGVGVVWWSFVLSPAVATLDPEPLTFAISVAYPIGDMLLLGMALGLFVTPGAKSASFRLLVASLVALLGADLVYNVQSLEGTYVDGSLLDGVYLASYVLFAMAATHPTMTVLFDPRPVAVALLGPIRLMLLGGAMLIGPALLVIEHVGSEGVVLVAAAATAVVSVLVVARLAGMVGHLAKDIERRTVLEAQLSYQAFHDPLTGLANRRRFIEAVGDSIAAGRGSAVLFLDLDDFKHVNDQMGHDAGDALLSAVGHRIVASIRPDDLGCRIGGDEFAVLLPHTSQLDEAETVGRRLLDAMLATVPIEGQDLVVPASIGAAAIGVGETVPVDELLRRADVAMYHAKAQGKNRLASFTPALDVVPGTSPVQPPVRHARATDSAGAAAAPSRFPPSPRTAPTT
jgi:diguanylate cyclase (GGDEF)-like protein